MGGTVLVTVGSTLFDALVSAVDSLEVADTLVERGYSKLVIQLGSGQYLPKNLFRNGGSHCVLDNGLAVEWFRFAPSLKEHLAEAALVISHAGSASAFETLEAGLNLIAIPNPKLMANHQQELAKALADQKFCVYSTPEGLPDTIKSMDLESLRPFEKGDPSKVSAAIDRLMGRRGKAD